MVRCGSGYCPKGKKTIRKGKKPLQWLVVSFFTGLFALIAVLFSKDQEPDKVTRRKTQYIGFFFLAILLILAFPIWQLLYRNFQTTISQKQQVDQRIKLLKSQVEVNLQQCHYSYGIDGTSFGMTVEFTNKGPVAINPPSTVWLLYKNKVCDKKSISESAIPKQKLFSSRSDGRWFGCSVELPASPKDAERINRPFSILFTPEDKKEPLNKKDAVVLYEGNTKECSVAVE